MHQRWKSLEAGLAAMGSQAEAVLDCVEDEEDSGRAKPIDIEYLLSNVVPSVLNLSGTCIPSGLQLTHNKCIIQSVHSCRAEASYLLANTQNYFRLSWLDSTSMQLSK